MNTAVIKKDWIGQVVDGRFLLLEWIGGTEQASIFRTELQGPQTRRAAIRLIPAGNEDAHAQLDSCARMAALSHPHLMPIFRFGQCRIDGIQLLYIVTEYAEESLAQIIPERPLSTDEAREMLLPVVEVLSYLHGQGIFYRRLKPSNVMVVENQLKLPVDDLCYPAGSRNQPAHPSIYDAPETAAGSIHPIADVWSLGVTLVEALTQRPPLWDRSSHSDATISALLPRPFAEIARGCLRYDPGTRFTLRDIKALLDPAAPIPQSKTLAPAAPPAEVASWSNDDRKSASPKRRFVIIAASVITCLAAIVFLFTRPHQSQPSQPAQAQLPAPVAVPAAPSATPASQARPSSAASSKGEVAQPVMPDVSPSAMRTIHGKFSVKLRVAVDATGAVSNAKFDSRGPSQYFADRALEAVRHWKFEPAQANGHPVESVWTLRFEFRRSGTDITPVEVTP